MATFRSYKCKGGSVTWRATVRRKPHPSLSATFDTKTEAEEWATDQERDMRMLKYKDPRLGKVPFGDYIDHYYKTISPTKALSTYCREGDTVKALKRGLGTEIHLADITPRVISRYRDTRLEQVAPATVNKEIDLLSNFFDIARKEWEIPLENPVADVRKPKVDVKKPQILTPEEATVFLKECMKAKNELLFPFVVLLLQTGARSKEAALLRVKDIFLEYSTIQVEAKREIGKKPKYRIVPIPESVLKILTHCVAGKEPDDFIFLKKDFLETASIRLQARPAETFREGFESARKRANVNWLTMHKLRHTAASYMLMRGVDHRTIAEVLGHSTMQMVYRYTHPNDLALQKAIKTLDNFGFAKKQIEQKPQPVPCAGFLF